MYSSRQPKTGPKLGRASSPKALSFNGFSSFFYSTRKIITRQSIMNASTCIAMIPRTTESLPSCRCYATGFCLALALLLATHLFFCKAPRIAQLSKNKRRVVFAPDDCLEHVRIFTVGDEEIQDKRRCMLIVEMEIPRRLAEREAERYQARQRAQARFF
jgi:hypothetical protein